jgi:hypothetical protein
VALLGQQPIGYSGKKRRVKREISGRKSSKRGLHPFDAACGLAARHDSRCKQACRANGLDAPGGEFVTEKTGGCSFPSPSYKAPPVGNQHTGREVI